jgi:ferredoxin
LISKPEGCQMHKTEPSDPFLDKRIAKYDKWLNQGQISFSSKVIPVVESFDAKQWVHPTEQAMEILGNANSVAVQNCDCRSHYKRCGSPLEVCFVLNHIGDKFVSKGKARYVTLTEAAEILKKANESGLVHLSLYMPDHEIFALCSCCACCCHDLQIIKRFQRKDLMLRSDYVADTDLEACIHCGECIERCFFDARLLQDDDEMEYNPALCVGCGLCVRICPTEATSMLLRNPED